jgi:ubiquinone/menaquinone biosynthesis C-methylase UbiE
MNTATAPDDEQMRLWNGPGGRGWVEVQVVLDQVLEPFEDLLLEAVSARLRARSESQVPSSAVVLDVGCGTGGTTAAVARLLPGKGRCVGIDISEPMVIAARARVEREEIPATFVCADAQTHRFEPASFDMFISRFGVMFFNDPVQAFTNLRRAAREHAELRCIAWRSAAENPFMTAAERAAAPLLQNIPPRNPDGPGQFAFADRSRVYRILEQSGWTGINIQPIDIACTFPEKELVRYLTWMGPVGRILQQADERTRTQVVEAIRPSFDSYVHGDEVRFTAACWMVGARAQAS